MSRPSPDYPMLPTIPLSAFSDPKKTKTSHVSKVGQREKHHLVKVPLIMWAPFTLFAGINEIKIYIFPFWEKAWLKLVIVSSCFCAFVCRFALFLSAEWGCTLGGKLTPSHFSKMNQSRPDEDFIFFCRRIFLLFFKKI